MAPRSKQKACEFRLEKLESRFLCSRDGIPFSGYGSLTFSVAPDGAHVGNQVSSLQHEFNQSVSTSQWQQALARAFQTWTSQANINFGKVADNGAASGVYGPTRGDERFGDVRITGFDYATDSFAEAVSENAQSAGTWAGDIFFNTAVDWSNPQSIEAAALHEIGHILGLGHSPDPASPMHLHGPSTSFQLTAEDIRNVQAIHGPRKPDPNENGSGNDSISRASPIKGSQDDETILEGFSGNQVWIQFGDLLNGNDRDVYEIRTSVNYTGPLAVEVRTEGLSLAKLDIKLTDRNGNVLSHATVSNDFGGKGIVTLNQTAPETRYYLQVQALDAFWASGDYSITIASPTRLAAEADTIASWTREAHRWFNDSSRTEDGFSYQLSSNGSDDLEIDDRHSDDTIDKRVELAVALSTSSRVVYQTVGTLSDLIDIDHYRAVAPKELLGRTELVIDVESLQANGLVPRVSLFDKKLGELKAEVRVQGYGHTQLVWSNVQSEEEFVIRLAADSVDVPFRTGSFSLTATFSSPSTPPELLVAGALSSTKPVIEREWYVARPQLYTFSLEGLTSAGVEGQVWVSIFDEQRRLVSGMVAPLNGLRTAPGLFLDPGTYYLQISSAVSSAIPADVSFHLFLDQTSDPVGPLLGGTGVQPLYLCPGSTTEYCYPNSAQPTVNPQQLGPSPTTPLPPPATTTAIPSPSDWFWENNFLPTNPSQALDVSGNGQVDPLDVLIIINAINTLGAGALPTPPLFLGHLDTNANGAIDPLDALIVINYVNQK